MSWIYPDELGARKKAKTFQWTSVILVRVGIGITWPEVLHTILEAPPFLG